MLAIGVKNITTNEDIQIVAIINITTTGKVTIDHIKKRTQEKSLNIIGLVLDSYLISYENMRMYENHFTVQDIRIPNLPEFLHTIIIVTKAIKANDIFAEDRTTTCCFIRRTT